MTLILDLLWLVVLVLGSPVILYKLATKERWRVGILERFGLRLPEPRGEHPVIWVHAVSVGEVRAALPLVRGIERRLPGYEVVISTITSTGHEVARKTFPGNTVFFWPIDISFAIGRIFDAVRPELIVLVELELWPTFLTVAHKRGIPVAVVNGRISERSARRYRWLRGLLTRPIRRFCAQTEEYAQRFRSLGVPPERVLITGNLKYDTPALEAEGGDPGAAAAALRARLGIAPGAPVVVAGSTHPGEEAPVLEACRRLKNEFADLRLILAPRHLERLAEVEEAFRAAGVPFVRKTEVDRGAAGAPGAGARAGAAILVDTMGELARLYAVADVVFVGGSLVPHGGQNMLEPAGHGKPTLFGPNVRNFQAIADSLLRDGGAEMVRDAASLEGSLGALLRDRARAAQMGDRARRFVERHRGAAERTVEVLKEILTPPAAAAGASGPARAEDHFRGRSNSTVRI